jgi:hypothetical protein
MVIRAPFDYHWERQTLSKIVFENAIIDAKLMKGTALTVINIDQTSHPAAIQCYWMRYGS